MTGPDDIRRRAGVSADETVTRPVLRWLGGKFRLAPWIIAHLPPHDIYVEPYGGAASVLLRKPRAYNEVYNDLDGELVNLFSVLRGPRSTDLLRALHLTPYARAEYRAAFAASADPVERARRTIIRSHLGHGTGGARIDRATGFRSDGRSASTNVGGEWAEYPDAMLAVVQRLRGVVIEQVPALDLIRRYDTPRALLYLDPPYLPSTRSAKSRTAGEKYHTYAHELTASDHQELLAVVRESSAMIVLSGYPDPVYDAALAGWQRREIAARAHRNSPRREVIWINPAAAAALPAPLLFSEVAA